MAGFLKIVSGVYLALVWLSFVLMVMVSGATTGASVGGPTVFNLLAFIACITLSIPAVALYAFGQVVGDVRAMRRHLRAMHNYYEPQPLENR